MVAMLSFGLGFEFLFLACIGLCCFWGCGVFFVIMGGFIYYVGLCAAFISFYFWLFRIYCVVVT